MAALARASALARSPPRASATRRPPLITPRAPRARPRGRSPRTAAAAGPTPSSEGDSATASSSSSSSSSDDPDSGSPEMFDNLANIFLKREEEDWIGLLASSARWPTLRDGFFARLEERARDEEDPEEMLRLSRLLRLLRATSDRVAACADLLAECQDADEDLHEGMVTNRRAEFTTEFFQFVRFKLEALVRENAADEAAARAKGDAEAQSARENDGPNSESDPTSDEAKARLRAARETAAKSEDAGDAERDALARLASRLLSICEAFDEATKDQETLETAAENFKELLEVETLEEMNSKIDAMSAEGKLDPALVLTAAKAYMSVKESPYVEEEVKDVMAHLYFKMKETMGRQQPKEVRILKHLLMFEDVRDVQNGLEEAFTPGPELTTEDEDFLFCEAPALHKTIEAVLKAYEQQQGKASITGQAAELMTPEVIEKLKVIQGQIEANFL